MNILKRLFKPKQEERISSSSPDIAKLFGWHDTPGGHLVNANTAENLSTVLACVSAISSAVSSLPVNIYRFTEQGREIDRAFPLARLVRLGPNQWQTWPDFVEWLMASALLRGNGLAEIVLDQRGSVQELRPIPWESVSVQMLHNGRLVYDVTNLITSYGGTGQTRRLLQGEVLHLRDRSDNGLVGKSRLQRASAVIDAGLSVQEFAGSMYSNGANPSGALELDGKVGPEKRDQLARQFRDAFTGSGNAAKTLILDQGLKWRQISVSPEDAELLASRQFTTEELCRIYLVPPPVVQDYRHNTFTNAETAGRWFATNTLMPWIRKLEAVFQTSVFSEEARRTHELEFDLSGFLRGDPEQRWKAHEIAVKNEILFPNEIRKVEGWNPREGGDQFNGQSRSDQNS